MNLDFLNDDSGDLLIINGDFVIDNADLDIAKTITESAKGEIRKNPLLGVNISDYIGSNTDIGIIKNVISNELKKQGLQLFDVEYVDGNFNIKLV